MEKYSIGCIYTNSRFVIQNLYKNKEMNERYKYLVEIIKNNIKNNEYEKLSIYLKREVDISNFDKKKEIALIDKEIPRWINTIKGDDEKLYYPAKDFYENIIPNIFKGYEFIQKLVMPEASINEIVGKESKIFEGQHVDFYIHPCKLVIEVDGYHHRRKVQKDKDKRRDEYLLENNIKTVRIKTIEIKNRNKSFDKKISLILKQLNKYDQNLLIYKKYYSISRYDDEEIKYLKLNAIMRMKITIISLLEKGVLSFDDYIWKFNILARDIHDFIGIAIEDLFLDIEDKLRVDKISFKRPKLEILEHEDNRLFKFKESYINIDFSLNKRWTDENYLNKNIIFIRTDYY